MSQQIGAEVHDPYALYAAERDASFRSTMTALGLAAETVTTPWVRA
jgi:hypothetical protein